MATSTRHRGATRSGSDTQGWLSTLAAAAPVSRREQIVVALREAIVTGEIPTGAQLKQDDLSEMFHASPGPVREALRQLVSEGLVEHYPIRGSFVCELATQELLEVLLPMRVIAEKYAMEVISADLPPELVASLEDQIATMEQGAAAADLVTVIEADVQFHRIMINAADSYHVTQLWNSVLSRIRVQLYRLGPRHRTLSDVAEEHRQLLAALQSGKATIIESALHEHIIGASTMLLAPDNNEAQRSR